MQSPHFLIIGQGLAGSLLAYQLIKRQCTVTLVDHDHSHSATKIAAGMINPITGKRLVLTEGFPEYLASAKKLYQQLSDEFNQIFFHERPIHRFFQNSDEEAEWQKKQNLHLYKDYIGESIAHPRPGFVIHKGGWVNTPLLLNSLQQFFREHNCLFNEQFSYDDLKINEETLHWNNQTFNKVIFCEGYQILNNPFFQNLPFTPAQGEILTIETKNLNSSDPIFNSGYWFIPTETNIAKVGATYNWNKHEPSIDEKNKEEILKGVQKYWDEEISVSEHKGGVRLILKDLHPIVGWHPKQPCVGVLNGLGSKGLLMTPRLSQLLVENIINNTVIPTDVNVQRFNM